MDEESRNVSAQAAEQEERLRQQSKAYEAKIQSLQNQLAQQEKSKANQERRETSKRVKRANKQVVLDEALTRILIDQQLKDAGWTVDTQELTYKKGTRPEKGKNLAIAEWPTFHNGEAGRADYVLFSGLTPIAVIEAKKENKNVAGKIGQAERYSKGFKVQPPLIGAWAHSGLTVAWPDELDAHYHIPFVYSCNGRPFVPQLAEQSGTWFRDVRDESNLKRALQSFHTPEGLMDLLSRSKTKAEQELATEPFAYLKLRDYQEKAIIATESAIAHDLRTALLAMATGTGKTRTIIGLMYRFLKTETIQTHFVSG